VKNDTIQVLSEKALPSTLFRLEENHT
jgi:hypothetical protein